MSFVPLVAAYRVEVSFGERIPPFAPDRHLWSDKASSSLDTSPVTEEATMQNVSRWSRLLAGLIAVLIVGLMQAPALADDLEALAARVQALEDREAIRALILAYGQAHDGRDYRAFSQLFAREGEWVGGLGSAKGPEAIFELMDRTIGHNPQPGGSGTFHVMTNDQIVIDGDRASSTTKWIYVTPGGDGNPRWALLGHYDDEFIREDGVWKFLRREAPVDIPSAPPGAD
jgi:hypothetical protein